MFLTFLFMTSFHGDLVTEPALHLEYLGKEKHTLIKQVLTQQK